MVYGHTIQLATVNPSGLERLLSLGINLATFSGFVFAYGVGVGLSNARRPAPGWSSIRRILEIYVAYVISSLAFVLLIEGHGPRVADVVQIAAMIRLKGFSEFLASFVVLAMVTTLLRSRLKALGDRLWFIAVMAGIGLVSTLIILPEKTLPLLPTLFGSQSFATFPVLPYSIWLVAGIAFAKSGLVLDFRAVLVAIAATTLLVGWTLVTGGMPGRFPPNFLWVLGAAGPLLIYLHASKLLTWSSPISRWLVIPGRYTLSILVGSNLILFAIENRGRLNLNFVTAALLSLTIIGGVLFLRHGLWLVRRSKRQPA